MRLLLDEHIDPVVAERLRTRGHDVIAVTERAALVGADDGTLFDVAFDERRAIVTYDIAGFRTLARARMDAETHHFGAVLLDPESFPQGKRYVGKLIAALQGLLESMPAEDALYDRERWPE